MGDYYDRQGNPLGLLEWASKFEDAEYRVVAQTELSHLGVGVLVSTVWLGSNHNWGGGPPLIFETMIFGGPLDQDCERYSTEAEALIGHETMTQKAQAAFAD